MVVLQVGSGARVIIGCGAQGVEMAGGTAFGVASINKEGEEMMMSVEPEVDATAMVTEAESETMAEVSTESAKSDASLQLLVSEKYE